ncbi:NUDIX domain-containing protein [Paenibacillus doosanensis]|uniref:Mutator protein MutT4 n=1 Tax=Paenibacillus konkukensis TaxID=2020716 RepID=A0ABY4RY39_9BACL|nr:MULTISPECIES: NUDIX domain-containing protein [Paenibacillus]MCS7464944.1 NUDIX domain-containing protein [Paenibacillus doosanensis]UQZ87586.1 Putative mutator protein MutT4 [Paenibacillus konkukensis]
MAHKLAAGVVIVKDETVLLVKDKSGWSLPKGSTEMGETFLKTAEREAFEETGLKIAVEEVAFITEYTSEKYGQYLHVYYSGSLQSEQGEMKDPDLDVIEVRFVNVRDLRNFIKFRPWLIPLEKWIQNRELKYHSFDSAVEGFYISEMNCED